MTDPAPPPPVAFCSPRLSACEAGNFILVPSGWLALLHTSLLPALCPRDLTLSSSPCLVSPRWISEMEHPH